MSEWTEYDELAKMGDEIKALLADREGLVRYVRRLRKGISEYPILTAQRMSRIDSYKALSQELKDEINANE